ncbi:MAG: hypothetical protein JW787_16775 [Sedimentisphaerales bacterium]|nr:hypothetical protein [Sedimentisphaerales bacterium]
MALHHSVIQRLAFVKYIFTKGIEQSILPEPFSAMSILMFHDAVEIFLQISSEKLNIGNKKMNFLDYWEALNQKLLHEIPQKEAMRRLNTSRVGLKHSGTLPSKLDIETFVVSVRLFFEETTTLIFETDFNSISLIEYVDPSESRDRLKMAEKQLQETKLDEAMANIAVSFRIMLQDYQNRKAYYYRRSPFAPIEDLSGISSIPLPRNSYELVPIAKILEKTIAGLTEIQRVVRILALGLDYRKYSRFEIFAPHVYQTGDLKYHVDFHHHQAGMPKLCKEDVRFCIDYVIESAIKLKEFDYSVDVKQRDF